MKEKYNEKYNVLERNVEPHDKQTPTKIVVHDGMCHADDVMAAYLARQINPSIEIYRTRNPEELRLRLKDPYSIVADVGCGLFDHHDIGGAKYYPGEKNISQMAACGLVWKEWGDTILHLWQEQGKLILQPNETIKDVSKQFRDYVLRPIEVKDTTAGRASVPKEFLLPDRSGKWPDMEQQSTVSDFVRSNDPVWLPMKGKTNQFNVFMENVKALGGLREQEPNALGLNPAVAAFTRQNDALLSQIAQNHEIQDNDTRMLHNYVKEELRIIGPGVPIFSFDNELTDLRVFKGSDVRLLLCPNMMKDEIQIRVVDNAIKLTREMVKDADFVHPQGHMCVIKAIEGRNIDECLTLAKQMSQEIAQSDFMYTHNIDAVLCEETEIELNDGIEF